MWGTSQPLRLAPSAGNPLASTVSECEANNQNCNFKHFGSPRQRLQRSGVPKKETNLMAKFLKGISGNPTGRPRDARNKLTRVVLEDILAHWNEPVPENPKIRKGPEALQTAWREKPVEYAKLVLSVMPKELAIENFMSDMTDHDIDELTIKIKE